MVSRKLHISPSCGMRYSHRKETACSWTCRFHLTQESERQASVPDVAIRDVSDSRGCQTKGCSPPLSAWNTKKRNCFPNEALAHICMASCPIDMVDDGRSNGPVHLIDGMVCHRTFDRCYTQTQAVGNRIS